MEYRQPFEGSYGISQGFGKTEYSQNHTGIDFLCPVGTPILASESGTVVYAGWKNGGYGYCVFIRHSDHNTTIYEHLLSTIPVAVGQKVARSQIIGYSGSTGNSTGPHLHFEIQNESHVPFDPMTVLHSSIDAPLAPAPAPLIGADKLGEDVEVVCPAGVKAWYDDFTKYEVFPQGTDLTYTGDTKEHNGYTYCKCYPAPRCYWVAVNDGDTQILNNA